MSFVGLIIAIIPPHGGPLKLYILLILISCYSLKKECIYFIWTSLTPSELGNGNGVWAVSELAMGINSSGIFL